MRLEFLFKQISAHIQHDSHWHSRSIIHTIGELLSITERGDLKAEMLKELDRYSATFSKLQESPGVDGEYLSSLIDQAKELSNEIRSINGQIGSSLKNDEFLLGITQRTNIPAGTCAFDLPGYHYWLEQPREVRDQLIQKWLSCFNILHKTSGYILKLARESSLPQEAVAESGAFQKSLDKAHPCQIVRVDLPKESRFFPEISGNKQHFSVRFMEFDEEWHKPSQTSEDVDFNLTICIF